MNQQSFDDIIKKKVQQFSAPVPADAWDNIMSGKKRRRGVFFWWMFGAMIAGGIFVGVQLNRDSRLKIDSKNLELDQHYNDDTVGSKSEITNKVDQQLHKNVESVGSEKEIISKVDQQLHENVESVRSEKEIINKADQQLHENAEPVSSEKGTAYETHQQSDRNNNDETTGSDKGITVNRNIDSSFSMNVIDIHTINGIYLKAFIDCNISHVVTDTNQVKEIVKNTAVWAIDFSFTPFIPIQNNEALSYLQRTTISDEYQTIFTANDTQTSEELSFAYSFLVRRKINRKFEVGTGLQYSRIREKVWLSGKEINTTFSVIQRLHNDNAGPYLVNDIYQTNTTGTRIIHAYNSYSTSSIPVFIQYAVLEQRYFSLYFNTGTYINVIRKYSNSIDGDFKVAYLSGLKQGDHKINVGVDLFAGLRLTTAGNKCRFFAEPNFRYSFMKNNTSNMINAKYIHQAGLSVGISYKIN